MRRLALALALVALLACGPALADADTSYASRPEVQAFIRDMAARHGFFENELETLFSRVQRQDAILKSMESPPEAKLPWDEYRASFVSEARVRAGVEFWKANRKALARARRRFGVPEEIVLAILGVETFYGRRSGTWRVVDALSTLAFDYPPRADYFRSELEYYLLLAREKELNVFGVLGSYAGAIGMPQFMPGSYLKYAVDFDGDGAINLRTSAADAIGSVANFLKQHGWRAGKAIQADAVLHGIDPRPFLADGGEPRHTLADLSRAGISIRGIRVRSNAAMPAALIELDAGERPSVFRVGFHNYYVLKQYNRSSFYASAVVDLGRALRAARRRPARGASAAH